MPAAIASAVSSAPDLPPLATKIEIAVSEQVAELSFGPPSLARLVRDARRLAAARQG